MHTRPLPARPGLRHAGLRPASLLAAVVSVALSCGAFLPTIGVTVATATLLTGRPAHATPVIDWVTVGNPGNVGQTQIYSGTAMTFGAVSYDYKIMKFEFTNSQYAAFLNAVDPDGENPQGIWKASMGDNARGGISQNMGNPVGNRYAVRSNMGDKPVNFVNWWDAARVSNWLHNGAQTYGTTNSSASAPQNTGAYTVGTATSGTAPAQNVGAKYWVPTENEWYKAAYYNPTLNSGAGGYTLYGNGFDAMPTPVGATTVGTGTSGGVSPVTSGNFANWRFEADWNGQNGNVTTVGTNGGSSYYGAFDMSGNLWEMNDLTGTAGSDRGARGGDWMAFDWWLPTSKFRAVGDTSSGADVTGFRLAAVPEPSTWVMGLAGIACAGFQMIRRRRAR